MTEFEELSLELLTSIMTTQMMTAQLIADQNNKPHALAKLDENAKHQNTILRRVANAVAASQSERERSESSPQVRIL
jgi:hypothetical protein